MMMLSGSRFEWIIFAEVWRKTRPLQSWRMPFWICRPV
jgi:hypothetical protein